MCAGMSSWRMTWPAGSATTSGSRWSAPVPLNLVCFRHVSGDVATGDLLTALNATGEVALTHTRLADRFVIRVSVGARATERRHVERLWELIDQAAPRVR